MRFGAKANVPYHKIADYVMKKGSDVNENSMSERIRCCSYDSYLKIVVIKSPGQTNNCEAARKYSDS
jgi:hypothetical protein